MIYLQQVKSIEEFEPYYLMKTEPGAVNWSGYASAPDREKLKEHFARLLQDPNSYFYYLTDGESDDIMGYSQMDMEGDSILFTSFCLLRKFQNAGLGSKLTTLSVEKAKELGAKRMTGWISEKNYASIRGFRSLGMRPTGETRTVRMAAFDRDDIYVEYEIDLKPI